MRKDEAIERTFSQAAENFSSVWKALVPEGALCNLILQEVVIW